MLQAFSPTATMTHTRSSFDTTPATERHSTGARTLLALVALLPLPAMTGCAAALEAAGYRGSEGVEVHSAQVRLDVEEVWFVAQDVFGIMSSEPLEMNAFPRTLTGRVDGARVELEVLAWDLNRTTIKARATRYGFADSRVGERVLQTVLAQLELRN